MPGIKIGRSKAQLPLRVEVEKILVPDGFTQTLNDHLLLVYTGKTRLARNLLQVTPMWPMGATAFGLCSPVVFVACPVGCGCGATSLGAAGASWVVTRDVLVSCRMW